MGPAEDIENHNVGGQIQNAFAPQDAADQGDPHETAVGIHAGETLNLIVPVFFFGDQHSGHGDARRMGENGQQAGEKKSLEKMGEYSIWNELMIIIGLMTSRSRLERVLLPR